MIGGDGEKIIHVEVDADCLISYQSLFLIFEFSERVLAMPQEAAEVWICRDGNQLDKPRRDRRCGWGVFMKRPPPEEGSG